MTVGKNGRVIAGYGEELGYQNLEPVIFSMFLLYSNWDYYERKIRSEDLIRFLNGVLMWSVRKKRAPEVISDTQA